MSYGYDNQYTTTSYGAQGGAGGGGFMNEGGGSQEGGRQQRDFDKETLRPLTIKQVNDATQNHPDAPFRIDNIDLTQVTIVGQIRNISTQVTNHTYKLDDGTGTIEVKQFIDPEAGMSLEGDAMEEDSKPKLVENAYARAWGRIKSFGSSNKRHIGAHVIRPVTDHNEIQYHLLEATAVHLQSTRGPPGGAAKANGAAAGQNGDAHGTEAATTKNGRQLPAGLSRGARSVYNCLSNSWQGNEGLHMHDIASKIPMELAEVGKAADELLNHGLIYTTIDDQTWAILDDF